MTPQISEIELFQMDLNYERYIKSLSIFQYQVHMAPEDAEFFGGLSDVTYHISRKRAGIYYHDQGPSFITTEPIEENELTFTFASGIKASLSRIPRQTELDEVKDQHIIMKLMFRELRKSIEQSGFRVRGYSGFDPSLELIKDIKASNPQLQAIIDSIGIYAGFHYRLRRIDKKYFLQISPKSTIEFKGDIYGLINSGAYSIQFLQDFCERIKLIDGNIVDMRRIDSKTCDDPLVHEKPFNGMTYLDYVNSIEENPNLKKDAKLLVVLRRRQNALSYATSEGAKPIIDFSHLANLDPTAYSLITKKMKNQSAERHKMAANFSRKVQLSFNGLQVKLSGHRRYSGNELISTYDNPVNYMTGYHFSPPFLTVLDRSGRIRHISEATGDKGAPQDLLTGKYLPFSHVSNVRLLLLAVKGYEIPASQLKEALANFESTNPSGRILRNVGCKFDVSEVKIIDSKINEKYSASDYDCAVIVGPKENLGVLGSYVTTELLLLECGIPAQYVIHAPSATPFYDKSIARKVNETYSFLTLVLSILAKIGANSIVLSSESTKYFPQNSVILSYNFARVFETLASNFDQHISLESMRASLPLTAAISVLDEAGSQITHQYPHVINDETALFRGERGKLIFDKVPDNSDMIVIHKDGMFSSSELSDIEKLQKAGIRIQPISIVTNAVPRIITSDENAKFVPKEGAVLPISSNEFLLSTTHIPASYDPYARGWPNPLSIKIHDIQHQEKTSTELKWKLLYQIWCLTRAHPSTIIPIRRPISIHYSNKMARFLRKSRKAQPEYFTKFADKKNKFGLYSRPFM